MKVESSLDICALSEKKLKGNGEFSISKIRSVKAGVIERYWTREGVAITLSKRM
jgi:hypothetical protein